jgi:hypothetical protein
MAPEENEETGMLLVDAILMYFVTKNNVFILLSVLDFVWF